MRRIWDLVGFAGTGNSYGQSSLRDSTVMPNAIWNLGWFNGELVLMGRNQAMRMLIQEPQWVAPDKSEPRPRSNQLPETGTVVTDSSAGDLGDLEVLSHSDLCQAGPSKPANSKPDERDLVSICGNKILVIDDDPFWCRSLKIRLKANSYESCFAVDGESGISTARTEKPDLIILDLGLPRGNGYFVMRSLHEVPELEGVPVIVLTARDGLTHEKLCSEAGAKRFFEKPVDNHHLLKAIRELMD